MLKQQRWLKLFPILLMIGLLIGTFANIISLSNLKLTGLTLIVLAVVILLQPAFKRWAEQLSDQNLTYFLVVGLVLIVLIQCLVLRFLPATVYHDPFRVLYQAERLSRNLNDWHNTTYFYRYANNVPLAILLSYWLRLTNLVHLTTNASLHLLSILTLDSFITLALTTAKKSQHRQLFLGLLLFFLISPFAYSYYLQVVYSDLPILLILLGSLTILKNWSQLNRTQKIDQGCLLFFMILLGQMIKANLIIFSVAIVLVLIYLAFADRIQFKQLVLPLVLILLAFGTTVPVQKAMENSTGYVNNNADAFPTTHWIYMSYSPLHNGTYSGEDVKTMLSLPSKQARQTYLVKALPKRLEKLGLIGILQRWLTKASIMLDVSRLQHAYTGGYRNAPASYQRHKMLFSISGALIFRLGFIFVYALAFLDSFQLFKTKAKLEPLVLLAMITAVGYLAFHTFLWETENRYGQPIFALLIFMLAQRSTPAIDLQLQRKSVRWCAVWLILLGLGFVIFSQPTQLKIRTIIAAQRSQLSSQYNAKPTMIGPDAVITQKIELNHPIDRATVLIPRHTNLSAQLLNLKTERYYRFKIQPNKLVLNRTLPAGHYQIVIRAPQAKAQRMTIIKTQAYQLAKYPLVVNHQAATYQSLVYTFSRKIKE